MKTRALLIGALLFALLPLGCEQAPAPAPSTTTTTTGSGDGKAKDAGPVKSRGLVNNPDAVTP